MAKDSQRVAASGVSQRQSGSAEEEQRRQNPENSDEIQFFDTTITKLVPVKDDDGNPTDEWEEVMSDNLAPGEKLKRAADEEQAEEKARLAREAANKAAEERK